MLKFTRLLEFAKILLSAVNHVLKQRIMCNERKRKNNFMLFSSYSNIKF